MLKQLVAWVGHRRVPGRPAAVLQGPRLRELRVRRPAHRAGEGLRPRARRLGQGVAADQRRQHPLPRVRARRRRHLRVVRRPADRGRRQPDAAPPPHRHRPVRRASTAAWCGAATSRSTSRASSPSIDELVGERQPDLLLLNDGDLTYAKIRLDERSLATVVRGLRTLDDSLARALCWGAAWDMTRDAEMAASDFVDARPAEHRQRDRRVRHPRDPELRRASRSTSTPTPAKRAELRATLGGRAARPAARRPSPAATHQLIFARPYAAAAGSRRGHRPSSPGCSTAR